MSIDPLVDRARRGDAGAIEEILRSNYDRVALICRRMTGSVHDGEDATQEALIAIVAGLPRFDGRSRLSTWVHRVTVNSCLDEMRRRSRRLRLVEAVESEHTRHTASSGGRDPSKIAGDRVDVDRALAELPLEFRAPVVLRDLLGYDYAEIADLLDVPPGTVRSRIARGRARLLLLLDPGNHEAPSSVEHEGVARQPPPEA